jgi:hypothetical protein
MLYGTGIGTWTIWVMVKHGVLPEFGCERSNCVLLHWGFADFGAGWVLVVAFPQTKCLLTAHVGVPGRFIVANAIRRLCLRDVLYGDV